MYKMPPHNWTCSRILRAHTTQRTHLHARTHTPSESVGCEQLGHTTESRSRGICQCDGLFGFPGDIKVAWLHVLGANGARMCVLACESEHSVCVCVLGGDDVLLC